MRETINRIILGVGKGVRKSNFAKRYSTRSPGYLVGTWYYIEQGEQTSQKIIIKDDVMISVAGDPKIIKP